MFLHWRRLCCCFVLLLFAWATVASIGCRGGEEPAASQEEAASAEGTETEEAPPTPQPSPPPKAEKKQPKKEEPKADQAKAKPEPLPENIADWVTEHYKQARKQGDPRLVEAVQHLGKRFAGTPKAAAAARLLASLLEKTPEPEPGEAPAGTPPGSSGGPVGFGPMGSGAMDTGVMPSGPPDSGSMPSGGMDTGVMPSGPPGGEGGEMPEDYARAYAQSMASGEESGMEGGEMGYPGYPGSGMYPGAAQRPARPKVNYASPELIRAIVEALGVNGSDAALDVMKQILSGKLETDNDRVAMEATLETLAQHMTPATEAILFQAITAPEKFRPADEQAQGGKKGQAPRPAFGPQQGSRMMGSEPDDAAMMMSADPEAEMGDEAAMGSEAMMMSGEEMSSAYPAGYGAMGSRPTGGKPLSAEELQQKAFALVAPIASEDFRLKLAQYLLGGNVKQNDFGMFADYLLAYAPENLPAQLVLYSSPTADEQIKSAVESHMLGYGSLALAGVLGIPAETAAPPAAEGFGPRRRQAGRGGAPGGFPGSEQMGSDPRTMGQGGGLRADDARRMEMMHSGMDEEQMGSDPRTMGQGGGLRGDDARRMEMMRSAMEEEAGGEGMATYPGEMRGSMPPGRGGGAALGARPGAAGFGGRKALGRRGFQAASKPPDPDLPFRLAKKLWAAEFTSMIERRVKQADSLDADPQTILLAGTVPRDSMRAAIARLLQGHWQEGPGPLESAGLLDWVVTDPGLYVIVKGLPRKEPETAASRTPQRGAARGRRMGAGRGRGRGRAPYGRQRGSQRPPAEQGMEQMQSMPEEMMMSGEMQPGGQPPAGAFGPRGTGPAGRAAPAFTPQNANEEWMLTSLELLKVLCHRFHEAADARPLAPASAGQEKQQDDLLPELRPNANVVAQYQIDLPTAVAEKLSGVPLDGLQVRYVRMEETGSPKVVAGFYRRKLNSPRMHEWGETTWIESLRRVPQSDRKRSVDVLITSQPVQPQQQLGLGQPRRETGVPMVVEVLSIELKDPAPPADEKPAATAGT